MTNNPAQPMMALNVSALRERLSQIRGAAQQIESLQKMLQSEISLISAAVADMNKLTSPPPQFSPPGFMRSAPRVPSDANDLSQMLDSLEPDDLETLPARSSRLAPKRQ